MLVCIIFAIMGYFYTYIDPTKIEAQFTEMNPEKKKRKSLEMPRKGSVEDHKKDRRSSDSSCDDKETKQSNM